MLRRYLLFIALAIAGIGQLIMLLDLIGDLHWFESPTAWLAPHVLLSTVAAFTASHLLLGLLEQTPGHTDVKIADASLVGSAADEDTGTSSNATSADIAGIAGTKDNADNADSAETSRSRSFPQGTGLFCLFLLSSLLMPLLGSLGAFAAYYHGFKEAQKRHREPDYWQVTHRAELPFTTPKGRQATKIDSRGFTEHMMYSSDDNDLYRKVLAAGNIRASLSVSTLKQAMRHSDERIRLTAYKTLDKKVTELNREIQQLEARMSDSDGKERSNSWLQIASNYWELLTLESGEPVARKQLLDKASAAAIQAVAVLPTNRNAHFILGRVSLILGETHRARLAFGRTRSLGMPADKVLPYMAEAAFKTHDFKQVRALLAELDASVKVYPPLSHVAEYWA